MGLSSVICGRARVVAVVALAANAACSNPFSSDDEGTHIRMRNASTFELTEVTFAPGTPPLQFARIGPGETTEYTTVENAYRYGYLDLLVAGEHRRIQPIDFVGEKFVGDGRFTYVITIYPVSRTPDVRVVEDE
jgi:hypothetical protein